MAGLAKRSLWAPKLKINKKAKNIKMKVNEFQDAREPPLSKSIHAFP